MLFTKYHYLDQTVLEQVMTFIDNKYTKIYMSLMEKRQIEKLLKEEIYCETHHIIPKSLGGTNDIENLVNLTPREHFVAHLLLSKMTQAESYIKMCWALHRMAFSGEQYFGSRDYDWFRKKHRQFLAENHPSRKQSWRDTVSKKVTKHWEDNEQRKKQTSETIKKWIRDNPEEAKEKQMKASILGAKASKEKMSKRVELNGVIYCGWGELTSKTGISKFLYNKFYKHGIDPTFRVGKDGPMIEEDVKHLMTMFCKKQFIKEPDTKEERRKIALRMVSVGLLTTKELEKHFGKESL